MKTSTDIRKAFLDFFHSRQHEIVASSSLVPASDPTLLFTNAGMVQFKDTFLGQEKRSYKRATSSQRCIRAGGKHNDLENVGYTARHHTFFEMLGNFSFGDYFKRDAIQYAWEFLTEVMQLPAEKLWVTVFDEDQEAEDIWLKEIKIDPTRFSRIGAKDNFWSMGETGPCGPCSEIFYDHGEAIPGGPPGTPEEEGDRYIEIWNLVFMQYDRDSEGKLNPLPKPSVDTGLGLERLVAILQNGHSNYDIDLFQALIKAIADIAACKDLDNNSLKVIADHIRSCSFMIVDGVIPSNEGRGYVLRRIIRRAIRHGHKLGVRESFFYKLVPTLVEQMGEAYPELTKMQADVEKVLKQEEIRFAKTLDQGMAILEQTIAELSATQIPGEQVFKLYDTYGFPYDLTADIARERNLTVDKQGFDQAMDEQRKLGQSASGFSMEYSPSIHLDGETEFTGYDLLKDVANVVALFKEGEAVEQLKEGDEGMLILDQTPFYAESGGQVGDHGELVSSDSVFTVSDTKKQGNVVAHIGKVTQGNIAVGEAYEAFVDESDRQQIAEHHSATHLMHAALRDVLGEHVLQKGSLVDSQRLRFDFSHFEPVTPEQLSKVEALVNTHIRCNHDVETKIMAPDEAIAMGAMALFGEKYGDDVRVLNMGDFSIELCGGTHVQRTGDIAIFKIISETGVAAGVRRIEAVAGAKALLWVEQGEVALNNITTLVKGKRADVEKKVEQLIAHNRQLEKQLEQLKSKMASSQGSDLASQAQDISGIKVLAAKLEGADVKVLRETLDQLKNKLGTSAVVLATVNGNKVSIVAGVSKNKTDIIKAGDLVNVVAEKVGGRGGGRADMAQAGGTRPEGLDAALKLVPDWVKQQIET
ncbi:alanine--tRNA ligase [Beggiatoa alba]|nr:alanine--tRNA ligase [Beggiatoa alba]